MDDSTIPYLHDSARFAVDARREWMQPILDRGDAPIITDAEQSVWWTFAGGRINSTARHLFNAAGFDARADNFRVILEEGDVHRALDAVRESDRELLEGAVSESLPEYRLSKFQSALPGWAVVEMLESLLLDMDGFNELLRSTKI